MEDGFCVVEVVVAEEEDYPSSQGDMVAEEEYPLTSHDVAKVEMGDA